MLSRDWRRLTKEAGLSLSGGRIRVPVGPDRYQAVFVGEPDRDLIRVWSVAARPSMLQKLEEEADLYAWTRNRVSDLVGFKTDARGRLIGEAWVPVEGLDAEEWGVYVRIVAQACDRVEYLLSGKDEW